MPLEHTVCVVSRDSDCHDLSHVYSELAREEEFVILRHSNRGRETADVDVEAGEGTSSGIRMVGKDVLTIKLLKSFIDAILICKTCCLCVPTSYWFWLTHCALVTPYGNKDLVQHWLY